MLVHAFQLSFRYSQAGQLCLYPVRGSVKLDGTVLAKNQMVPLSRSQHVNHVGSLGFRVDYVTPSYLEGVHRDMRNKFLGITYPGLEEPSPLISATPRASDQTVGGWTLHGVVGVGGTSVFEAASHTKRAQIVAIKSLLRKDMSSAYEAAREIDLYLNIRDDLEGKKYNDKVMHIEEVLYSGEASWSPSQPDKIWIFYSALGRLDFEAFLRGNAQGTAVTRDMKLSLFTQIMMGTSAIHAAGYIHRGPKPANVSIVSFQTPRAVVIDLDRAVEIESYPRPAPGTVSTIGYLAPELENYAYSAHEYYTEAVDVWSLGAIALDLFTPTGSPWRSVQYNLFRQPLDEIRIQELAQRIPGPSTPLQYLFMAMLSYHAAARITLEDALGDIAVSPVVEELSFQAGEKRRHIADHFMSEERRVKKWRLSAYMLFLSIALNECCS